MCSHLHLPFGACARHRLTFHQVVKSSKHSKKMVGIRSVSKVLVYPLLSDMLTALGTGYYQSVSSADLVS